MPEKKQTTMPFHVRIVGNEGGSGFRSGHETVEQANTAAKEANGQAEALGIKARYEAVEHPFDAQVEIEANKEAA